MQSNVANQSGTAPGDRPFRPDVEGLRAVAVIAVVLFHAGVPGFGGGYVGVDVFFVISGFVITGLLLRERTERGTMSLLGFYARRCRRILPAATLVIVSTTALAYLILGRGSAGTVAEDGKWAAAFLANFHFASAGTNYLSAQQPPSPLQNFWSLAVEEQFYLVYPAVFLVAASLRIRLTLRQRIGLILSVAIVLSFALSVTQTSSNPATAYFSPFTRAWELALGGLVAVSTPTLLRLRHTLARAMTWAGLGAVVISIVVYDAHTPYPGSAVSLPVIGTAFVIAGGLANPRGGAETILGVSPARSMGRLSYSLYLWHWPILIIAADRAGKRTLGVAQNLELVLLSCVVSYACYRLVENPIRHAVTLIRRRWRSITVGVGAAATAFAVSTVVAAGTGAAAAPAALNHNVAWSGVTDVALHRLLVSASTNRQLPVGITPPVSSLHLDWGGPPTSGRCWPEFSQSSVPSCDFGATRSKSIVVLYGDSHAAMWLSALSDIARREDWRLVLLTKPACGVGLLPFVNPRGWHALGGEYSECDQWHRFAMARIAKLRPRLVIASQSVEEAPGFQRYSTATWRQGLERALRRIDSLGARAIVLGNIPSADTTNPGVLNPICLSVNADKLNKCGTFPGFGENFRQAEAQAAAAAGARYLNVVPWFCLQACPAVIGHYGVYMDPYHLSATYSRFLEPLLAKELNLAQYLS